MAAATLTNHHTQSHQSSTHHDSGSPGAECLPVHESSDVTNRRQQLHMAASTSFVLAPPTVSSPSTRWESSMTTTPNLSATNPRKLKDVGDAGVYDGGRGDMKQKSPFSHISSAFPVDGRPAAGNDRRRGSGEARSPSARRISDIEAIRISNTGGPLPNSAMAARLRRGQLLDQQYHRKLLPAKAKAANSPKCVAPGCHAGQQQRFFSRSLSSGRRDNLMGRQSLQPYRRRSFSDVEEDVLPSSFPVTASAGVVNVSVASDARNVNDYSNAHTRPSSSTEVGKMNANHARKFESVASSHGYRVAPSTPPAAGDQPYSAAQPQLGQFAARHAENNAAQLMPTNGQPSRRSCAESFHFDEALIIRPSTAENPIRINPKLPARRTKSELRGTSSNNDLRSNLQPTSEWRPLGSNAPGPGTAGRAAMHRRVNSVPGLDCHDHVHSDDSPAQELCPFGSLVRRAENSVRFQSGAGSLLADIPDSLQSGKAVTQRQVLDERRLERRLRAVCLSFALYGAWDPEKMMMSQRVRSLRWPRFLKLCEAAELVDGVSVTEETVGLLYDRFCDKDTKQMPFAHFTVAIAELSQLHHISVKNALQRVVDLNKNHGATAIHV